MKIIKAVIFAFAVMFIAASFPLNTFAQEEGKGKKKEKKKGGGPIILDEIVIEGRVQKPQAFYILQRSTFGYKITELEKDYIDDIVDSVKNEVF